MGTVIIIIFMKNYRKFSVHDLRFIKCQNRSIIKLCDWFSANITIKALLRLGCQTHNNDLTAGVFHNVSTYIRYN